MEASEAAQVSAGAVNWQTPVVWVIIGLTLLWLAWRIWRRVKRKDASCGCDDSCGCSVAPIRKMPPKK